MLNKFPREVPIENIENLSEIFTVNWPKHVVIHSTIQTFIKRFKIFPELKEKVKIFALSEKWRNDGSFYLTVRIKFTIKNIFKFQHFSLPAMKLKLRCFSTLSTILSVTF